MRSLGGFVDEGNKDRAREVGAFAIGKAEVQSVNRIELGGQQFLPLIQVLHQGRGMALKRRLDRLSEGALLRVAA